MFSYLKRTPEVRQYMKYFSSVEADRFAIIRVSGDILHEPEQTRQVAGALAFLHKVGLVPVVVHGAGIFTGRRSAEMTQALETLAAASQEMDMEETGSRRRETPAAKAALKAGGRYLRAANEALVAELERAGVPAAAFPTGVFECELDETYNGPMRGLVGRILHSDGDGTDTGEEDEIDVDVDVEGENAMGSQGNAASAHGGALAGDKTENRAADGRGDEGTGQEDEGGEKSGMVQTLGIQAALAAKKVPVVASLGWDSNQVLDSSGNPVESSTIPAQILARKRRRLLTFPTADAVGVLARSLQPLKVVYLRREGGIRREDGTEVGQVVLASDLDRLLTQPQWEAVSARLHGWNIGANGVEDGAGLGPGSGGAWNGGVAPEHSLRAADVEAVREAAELLRPDLPPGHAGLEPGTTVSVTSPQHLASELFLSQGAGTLITRGERVRVLRALPWDESEDFAYGATSEQAEEGEVQGDDDDDDGIEPSPRKLLHDLLEKAFGAKLQPGYWASIRHKLRAIYVLESWRGAAIVTNEGADSTGGLNRQEAARSGSEIYPYLCKFAVDPTAQGEQLGQAVWRALITGERRFCWRSRSSNPVNGWYFGQSDGSYLAYVRPDGSVHAHPAGGGPAPSSQIHPTLPMRGSIDGPAARSGRDGTDGNGGGDMGAGLSLHSGFGPLERQERPPADLADSPEAERTDGASEPGNGNGNDAGIGAGAGAGAAAVHPGSGGAGGASPSENEEPASPRATDSAATTGAWTVFWRGLRDAELLPAVRVVLQLPPSFDRKAKGL